jgi:hypothetical protein
MVKGLDRNDPKLMKAVDVVVATGGGALPKKSAYSSAGLRSASARATCPSSSIATST